MNPIDILQIISFVFGIIFFIFAVGELKGKYVARFEQLESDIRKLKARSHRVIRDVQRMTSIMELAKVEDYYEGDEDDQS